MATEEPGARCPEGRDVRPSRELDLYDGPCGDRCFATVHRPLSGSHSSCPDHRRGLGHVAGIPDAPLCTRGSIRRGRRALQSRCPHIPVGGRKLAEVLDPLLNSRSIRHLSDAEYDGEATSAPSRRSTRTAAEQNPKCLIVPVPANSGVSSPGPGPSQTCRASNSGLPIAMSRPTASNKSISLP